MKKKICSKCGEEKPLEEFVKDKSCKSGYKSYCKKCKNEHAKRYRRKNKKRISEQKKQYYIDNKERITKYKEQYRKDNKEKIAEHQKQYYMDNREKLLEQKKQYYKENPQILFNHNSKRRNKEENQGRGITKEQWYEMMKFFDWKCAYSNEKLKSTIDTHGRTVDHIVALRNGGLNEPWNCIPMRKGYNCSKKDKINSLEWYMNQEYFDIDRLDKIVEWQIYSYNKWATEDDEDLILIIDI